VGRFKWCFLIFLDTLIDFYREMMFKNFVMTFSTSIGIMAMNIIGGILTARLLGPVGKGELTAVMIWPGVLAAVGSLGLAEAIVYFASRETESRINAIVPIGVIAAAIQTIILFLIGLWLLPLLMQNYDSYLVDIARIYLLFIPLNLLILYGVAIFQGRLLMGLYNSVRFLVSGSYVIGVLTLAFARMVSIRNCVIILLSANFIVLLFVIFWFVRLGWTKWTLEKPLLRQVTSYGLRAHIGNISLLLNLRLDQMIMSVILAPRLLGLYAVAVTISSGVNLVSSAVSSISFPILSSAQEYNRTSTIGRFLRFNIWLSGSIAVAMVLLMSWLIYVLFGLDYVPAISTAQVLVVAAVISGLNSVLGSVFKGLGKPLVSSYGEVISLVVTGISLAILLPKLQIMGAALASLMAYLADFVFMYGYLWRKQSVTPRMILIPQVGDFLTFKMLITKYGRNRKDALKGKSDL
jgi:O-antigen/teichoic acid export membrane protein